MEETAQKTESVLPPIEELKLPPKRKIAVLGSAVSSIGLVPFSDPEWETWGCSPANRNLPRVDVWFELHNIEVKRREGLNEWCDWLAQQPVCYLQRPLPEFPNGRMYPIKEMMAKYGRYWFTNQISYMLALAIEQKPAVLGIYGVDMAANSEYNQQRPGCQFFILEAQRQGITVVVPPESDLLEPPPLYGYCESSRRWRKYYARELELRGRIDDLSSKIGDCERQRSHLIGALDDHQYHQAHWANTLDFD